jgi:hypothetical protein|tara:strand:+ start:529 stop:681 length:153 start_codon:yes stop_codon:yes gene_type:complete
MNLKEEIIATIRVALENNNTPEEMALREELINIIKQTVAHDMRFNIQIME